MEQHKNKWTSTYSGGMKRKLNVGVALIGNPPIILLDEPTAGIDLLTTKVISKLILDYKSRGGVVLLTSHYFSECETLCDRYVNFNLRKIEAMFACHYRIIILKAGLVIEEGTREHFNKKCNAMFSITFHFFDGLQIDNRAKTEIIKDVNFRLREININSKV